MKQDQLKPAYDQFFLKSDAGKYFIDYLSNSIDNNHKQAENNAEKSRDYIQNAKGIRTILEHITSVTTNIKKGKDIE